MSSEAESKTTATIFETLEEMKVALKNHLSEVIKEALIYPGVITIGVSSGLIAKVIVEVFPQIDVNWKRVKIFMIDENLVQYDHSDSTYGEYLRCLPKSFSQSLIRAELIEKRDDRIRKGRLDADYTAKGYDGKLKRLHNGSRDEPPKFDLILLGVDRDGYTASLFPRNSPWEAKNIVFILTGEERRDTVKVEAILEKEPDQPASHLDPVNGTLKYFLVTEIVNGNYDVEPTEALMKAFGRVKIKEIEEDQNANMDILFKLLSL